MVLWDPECVGARCDDGSGSGNGGGRMSWLFFNNFSGSLQGRSLRGRFLALSLSDFFPKTASFFIQAN